MKKIVLIIILLLGIKGFSQHPDLTETTWYLHKIVIENETTLPLITTEVSFFDFEGIDFFSIYFPYCEQGRQTSVYYTNEDTFNLTDDEAIFIIGFCYETEIIDFMNLHASVYFSIGDFKNPFSYTIESDGDNYMLTIENGEGDIAVYGDVALSQPEFSPLQVTLYPNPVKDVLHINSTEIISEVSVYNIQGKVIKTVSEINSNTSEINLSSLQNGVYFVSITSENGGVLTQKIVKK